MSNGNPIFVVILGECDETDNPPFPVLLATKHVKACFPADVGRFLIGLSCECPELAHDGKVA